MLQRPKRKWRLWLIGTCLILQGGCVTAGFSAISGVAGVGSAYFDYKTMEKTEPVVVSPDVVSYSEMVQTHAADELERLGQPCPRDSVLADCSAIARMIVDYGKMRDQVRVLQPD
ncbi:MAG TPA: hypothetical protein DCY55_12410 [Gammaproteobacteria bacterium]|nr:hypothetical protein [Gammaproteobacteria bacterium]